MKKKLLIVGASGHGKVVADIAIKMKKWCSIAFFDDDDSIKTSVGLEVIGKPNDAFKYIKEAEIFVAIGNNIVRKKILEKFKAKGASVPVLVHPNAVIGTETMLGIGTVVMAGVVINSSTKIGKGCIINTGATLDHDNLIGNYVHISPGTNLAGTVKVGEGSWIGIGCKVCNNVNIIDGCIIGAGAVVVKDITVPGTYVGIPARKI